MKERCIQLGIQLLKRCPGVSRMAVLAHRARRPRCMALFTLFASAAGSRLASIALAEMQPLAADLHELRGAIRPQAYAFAAALDDAAQGLAAAGPQDAAVKAQVDRCAATLLRLLEWAQEPHMAVRALDALSQLVDGGAAGLTEITAAAACRASDSAASDSAASDSAASDSADRVRCPWRAPRSTASACSSVARCSAPRAWAPCRAP